jgi:hypothetical protein
MVSLFFGSMSSGLYSGGGSPMGIFVVGTTGTGWRGVRPPGVRLHTLKKVSSEKETKIVRTDAPGDEDDDDDDVRHTHPTHTHSTPG